MDPQSQAGAGDVMVTCKHCMVTQKYIDFFDFCEYCKKPLDVKNDHAKSDFDRVSFVSKNLQHADDVTNLGKDKDGGVTQLSWNTNKGAKKWKGLYAARPVDYNDDDEEFPQVNIPSSLKKNDNYEVDFVVLDEVTEVVKYESMNIVDTLLLIDSQQKRD